MIPTLRSKNLPLLATAENTPLCKPKKNTTGLKTLLALFMMVMGMGVSWGQSTGDFRSRASGNWNTATTWERYSSGAVWQASGTGDNAAGLTPTSASSVYIQTGHTVTLTQNEAVNNLNVSNGTAVNGSGIDGVLQLATFTLSVSGSLRSYYAASNGIPGTNDNTVTNMIITTAGTTGTLKFVGNNRDITTAWGAGNTGATSAFAMDISMTAGQTATMSRNIKAKSWVINSGTLDVTARINVDNGTNGDFTIVSGATVKSSQTGATSNAVITRTNGGSAGTLLVSSGATLILTGAAPTIAMTTVTFSGTVEYAGSDQTLAVLTNTGASPNTYTNLTLSGTGTKTLGVATTVNGTLSMQGNATVALALNALSLTYGASSTLEYASTSANQTTATAEFPASGAAPSLKINNTNASGTVTLHAARTLGTSSTGVLTLTKGALITTGTNTLTLANTAVGAVSGGDATAYVSGPLSRTLPASLASSSNAYIFPIGKGGIYFPVTLNTVTSGASTPVISFEATNASSGGSAGSGLSAISPAEYWQGTVVSGNFTSGKISLTRQSALSTLDAIAQNATTLAGVYDNKNGTASTPSVNNSDLVTSLGYFVLGTKSTGSATPPTLTAASSPTVDANFDVTFTDDATWRAAVTAVKYGTTTLTASTDYSFASGILTLKPGGTLGGVLRTAGTATVTVVATGYTDATVSQTIGVGVPAALTVTTQPAAPATSGAVLATMPAVTVKDQYANVISGSVVTASVTSGQGSSWTLGGATQTATTNASGVATFTTLTATNSTSPSGPYSTATLTFTPGTGAGSVASNTFTIKGIAPTVTGAVGATVDAAFDATFTENATWRAAITGITVSGTALTAGYSTATSGVITFTPSLSSTTTLLQAAGVNKSIVVTATGYPTTTFSQTIGVGAASKLAISVQPTAPTTNGGALAQQPTVLIQDQYGNTTASTATVTATAVQGTWTAGGSNTKAGLAGSAAFSGLTATSAAAVTGATIAFSSAGLTGVTSGTFNIAAPPPVNDNCSGAIDLTINAAAISGTFAISSPMTGATKKDVFYMFTPSVTGSHTITINGYSASGDRDLYIYSECPSTYSTTTNVVASGTGTSSTSETVTSSFTAGTSYKILVQDFAAAGGTFNIAVTAPIPTITVSAGALSAVNTTYGSASASPTSFTVSGASMSEGITVTPPAGYEVSQTSSSTGYAGNGTAITITGTGTIASKTIYVRLAANATVASSPFSGNIVLTSTGATTVNKATVSSTVTAKALTITGLTGDNKPYDRLTTATATGTAAYDGLANGEAFAISGTPVLNFDTATVGNTKPITVTGYAAPSTNYTVTQPSLSANITAVALTISGITADNKSFDGTTTATLSGTPTYVGLVSPETFSVTGTAVATFDDAAVGTGKTVNVSGYTAPSSNYTVTQPVLSADITAAVNPTISASGTLAALSTVYGTASTATSFTVVGSSLTDNILVTPPNGFEVSQTVGGASGYATTQTLTQTSGNVASTTIYVRLKTTATAGSQSGNIVLTSAGATNATIATTSSTVSTKALTITGLTANEKVYNGLTDVSVTGTAIYTGLENSETFTVSDVVTWAFTTNGNVGTAKPITQTDLYTVPSANYSISQPILTANITTAPLTITASAQSKNFGVASATTGATSFTTSGLQSSDAISSVTLGYSGSPTGNLATATAGLYTITPSAPVFSTGVSSNYSITYATGTLTIAAVVPGAPTIGSPTVGNGQVTIAYTAPTSNGGSIITSYTATSDPGGFTGSVNQATSGSIVVSGLTNGTAYTFTVTATNTAGTGAASAASASATPRTVSDAPTIGTAAVAGTSGTATVTFTAPVSNGGAAITAYTVTTSPAGGTGSLSQAGSGTITVTGLTNGTAYTFTVTATNAAGVSAASAASNSVTPYTVPGAPTIGTATAGNGQATVTFTAPASNGGSAITSYTATSTPSGLTGTLNQADSGTITVTGLANGMAYTFTITATNAAGASAASAASNSVTPVVSAPTATAASSILTNGFTANWAAVTNATGYLLDVYTNSSFQEDFTDGDISGSPTWSNTTNYAYETATTLTSGSASTDGKYIGSSTTAGNTTSLISSSEVSEWNFSLGSPNTDFSSTNYFGVILMSSASVANISASFNGYYLKCGVSSATDMVELWKSAGPTKTKLGDFSITLGSTGAGAGINLRITRSSIGVFQAYYSTGFTYAATPTTDGGTFTDATYTTSSYFGLFTNFANTGSTRRVYLDNLVFATPVPNYVLQNSTVSGTSQAVTGLTEATTYYYRVRATDAASTSANSNVITVATKPSSVTWNGSAWSNTSGPDSDIEAVITGNYNTTENGAITSKKLTVNSGVLTVTSGYTLTVTDAVINNASATALVFENNANLIQTNDVANTGNAIINRNSASIQLYDYTLWSSPVTNADQYLTTFSPNTLATRFYTYNSDTNFYNVVNSPSTTNFADRTGYLIRAPNNWVAGATAAPFSGVFTGVPNNGTLSKALNYTDAARSFNLVGNPYPSTIDAETFITANSSSIENTLYFWRKTNGALGSAYATYTLGGATTSTPTSAAPNGTIQVGQGFFVKAKSATTLNFTNAMRLTSASTQFFRTTSEIERNRIWLNLTNTSGVFSQMLVGYMTDATLDVDALDGKYINDSPFALTSLINSEEYTIQGKPLPFDTNDTVPLGFKTNAAGNFTISIDHVDGLFSNGQTIFLKDNLANTTVNLSAGAYTFASEVGVFNSRFEIVYQSALVLPTFTANNVVVYSQNGDVTINSGTTEMDQVRIFDVRGRLLAERSGVHATEIKLNIGAQNQVLLVKITAENGSVVTKKIIQ